MRFGRLKLPKLRGGFSQGKPGFEYIRRLKPQLKPSGDFCLVPTGAFPYLPVSAYQLGPAARQQGHLSAAPDTLIVMIRQKLLSQSFEIPDGVFRVRECAEGKDTSEGFTIGRIQNRLIRSSSHTGLHLAGTAPSAGLSSISKKINLLPLSSL